MRVRFETVLRQVAEANGRQKAQAPQRRARRRRGHGLEERLRARDTFAERIAFGIGAVLAVSSFAFAAHAIGNRPSEPLLPSVIPSLANGLPTNRAISAAWRREHEPETTGSVPAPAPEASRQAKPTMVAARPEHSSLGRGYVVRKVVNGTALVEGPDGLRDVIPGNVLPGAGTVTSIELSDAGWIVVTSETVIGSAPL